MKKYEIIKDDYKELDFATVYRIRALKDIKKYGVKAGDLGGYIEDEENLSHKGKCWVDKDSIVFDDAYVSDDAIIINSIIDGTNDEVNIYGNSEIINSRISDEVSVYNSIVKNVSDLYGDGHVFNCKLIIDEKYNDNKHYIKVIINKDFFDGKLTAFITYSDYQLHNPEYFISICYDLEFENGIFNGTIDEFEEFLKAQNKDYKVKSYLKLCKSLKESLEKMHYQNLKEEENY